MAATITDESTSCTPDLQPLWHHKAPRLLVDTCPAEDFVHGWKTWQDHLRKRKIRKEESALVETSEGPIDRTYSVEEERAAGDPERNLWNRQLSSRILAALEELTPRERMVFELRHYQGMRLRAIGEILETTEEAAKNCLFRATQKMRAGLGDFV